ncbi:MAG: DNA replication and repair protein RecF [Eggerthellaceae bacterium]|nr:DNA replication and repair protein RecF [Eggerthellaceae bacterium]
MALTISRIEFYQFRNYPELVLDGLKRVNVFIGENAVGKTNILEGIHLACACRSFRNASTEQLVTEGADIPQSRVALTLEDENRNLSVEVLMEQGRRTWRLNGKGAKSSDIRGLAPTVVFTPDDLLLIKGPQQERRGALDVLGSQITPNHQTIRLDFDEVLRHKNRLLKDEADPMLLETINGLMVTCGAQLTFYRYNLFSRLAPKIISRYERLSSGKESLTCEYVPSWVEHGHLSEEEMATDEPRKLTRDEARTMTRLALERRFEDERTRQRTIIGPQADKIFFKVDGRDASAFASQGQQRTIVLAWKLAEVDLITEVLGHTPILLLDDVMSELDGARRAALEVCIDEAAQAFITTTNSGYFSDNALQKMAIITLPR